MAVIPEILLSNPLGLLALVSVIPLIILYLLRPKTIDLDVPSLLFFIKREQQRNRLSLLLRRLIRDPLFIIQLLVLILLALAMAGPYILDERASGQHTVIIIDNSASMQAGGRLDAAKSQAVQRLSGVNSVIWAQNVPVLAVREADSAVAEDIIALTPQRAVASDLAAAITYADRLAGPGGTVIVYSDFTSWTGDDPLVAKHQAEFNGIKVEFVPLQEKSGNIGITNGWLEMKDGEYNLNLVIKNFNDESGKVNLDIRTGGAARGGSLDIPARKSGAYIVSDLALGTTEISIDNGGSMEIDDRAYVSILSGASGRILLVDTRNQNPTRSALELLLEGVDYSTSLPGDLSQYGIIILGNINNGSLGPDPAALLTGFVENGGAVVATASQGAAGIKGGLLPIMITGTSNETDLMKVADSQIVQGIPLTDVEVVRHLRGTNPEGSTLLMEASDGSPMLSYWRRGEGTVVYVGLNDITGDEAWSGFNTLPEFPLFWNNMIEWLGGTNIGELNVKTGTMIRLPSRQAITSPDGSIVTTTNLWIDQAGFYNIGGQTVGANLYDSRESDVDGFSIDAGTITSKYKEVPETLSIEVRNDISSYLIWLILGLLLLELVIIRRRRELF